MVWALSLLYSIVRGREPIIDARGCFSAGIRVHTLPCEIWFFDIKEETRGFFGIRREIIRHEK